jgi:hypothetical protein
MSGQNELPEWDALLASAVRLQRLLPDATLVGGTAAALHANHRRSLDADNVLVDLASRFEQVRAQLERAVGWQTSRLNRPVQLMGSLDGILTTVRNLIRSAPLEVVTLKTRHGPLRIPTRAEMLRIKAYLAVMRRNATRDYLDLAALADGMSDAQILQALARMDALYPQPGDPGAVRQQIIRQLANPRPYDLESIDLRQYKGLAPGWQSWARVRRECQRVSVLLANAVATRRQGYTDVRS